MTKYFKTVFGTIPASASDSRRQICFGLNRANRWHADGEWGHPTAVAAEFP